MGANRIVVKVDGTQTDEIDFNSAISGLSEGNHTITVEAYDGASLISSQTKNVIVPSIGTMFPTTDLISYYKMDETTGGLIDSHGTNDGVISGSMVRGESGLLGNSYKFNGTNTIIDIAGLDNKFNGTDWSIGVWFKKTVTPSGSGERLIQNRGAGRLGGGFPGFQIKFLSGSEMYQDTIIENLQGDYIVFENIAQTNEFDGNWQLITLSWNTALGRARLYKDAVLLEEQTNSDMINADLTGMQGGLTIGQANNDTQTFNGNMDEIFFYQKELTQLEIDQIYNSGAGITY